LVAKGLNKEEYIEYPCHVVNRFQCPYERTNIEDDDDACTSISNFDVEDLFELQKMAFVVEIELSKVRKDDSEIQIKDKQDLLRVLKKRNTFSKILQQANEILESTGHLREISAGQDADYIHGQLTFVPKGYWHDVENIGNEEAKFIVVYNSERPEDLGISGSVGSIPTQVLDRIFGINPPAFFDQLNYKSTQDIVIG
jgi:Cupin